MTTFIANNWIAIVAVLAGILVGLVIALFIMDRRDKKLIAEYKASMKAVKAEKVEVKAEPEVVAEPEPVTFVSQADLFVAPVAPEVPTAQIVQEAQPSLGIKFDVNVAPSFASNASLDELVMASQEMFLEGVKNLVQTIQEKVYREMYNKEAELKAKEEMLNQREKMLNEQMMSMMSNFAAMQNKPAEAVQATTILEENN